MAKVWLCRSGVIRQSCGAEPLAQLSVSEGARMSGLQPSDYLCALSEVGQHELPASLDAPDDGRVRVEMGQGTSLADPEHVVVTLDATEETKGWQPGVYRLKISCGEARDRRPIYEPDALAGHGPGQTHKYNLIGENNPYWTIAEPLLMKTWADAIVQTPALNLHLANLASFAASLLFWGGGAIMRLAAVSGVLAIAYVLSPEVLFSSLHALLWPSPTDGPDMWIYKLVGYGIIIESTVIVLTGLRSFLLDCLIYFALAVTNMMPLRIIARNLQKGLAMAQMVAKTSFMGTYFVQTMTPTTPENQRKWDTVMNLYINSNKAFAREKLERLATEFSLDVLGRHP